MPSRYYTLVAVILVFLASFAFAVVAHFQVNWTLYLLMMVSGVLSLVGLRDITQTKQAIRRNYPILAHFRFFFEYIRPEIRQYFIESENEAFPFSRASRSLVYQRAKKESDKRPFGTLLDVYEAGYEWMNHSISPTVVPTSDFRITIGERAAKPYSASVFNVSAMSFRSVLPDRRNSFSFTSFTSSKTYSPSSTPR